MTTTELQAPDLGQAHTKIIALIFFSLDSSIQTVQAYCSVGERIRCFFYTLDAIF